MGKDKAKEYGRLNGSEGAVLVQNKTYKNNSRKRCNRNKLNLYKPLNVDASYS